MKMTYQEALNLLGLRPGYTEEQLKKAFRKAAHETHPDKHLDRDTTDEFKKVNCANDLLKQYLKDPVRAREAEQEEIRRRAAERDAEEKRRQAEKDAAERKKRAEEAAERRAKEAEEKRRNEQKRKCETVYSAFYKCRFFRDLNISLEDFYTDRRGLFTFYNSLYYVANDIYTNSEKYIRRYENRHRNRGIDIYDIGAGKVGAKIKANSHRRSQRKDYASRMREDFTDFTSALTTTYNCFFDYIDYAYVLDELDYTDLKNYILLDDESREKKKDDAERILVSEDLFYAGAFLNSLDKEEFKDIHNHRFRDSIILINDVRRFVNENVRLIGELVTRLDAPEYDATSKLLATFKKNYSHIDTNDKYYFTAYLYSIVYKAQVIYRHIPNDLYKFDGDFKKVAELAAREAKVDQLYRLVTKTPGFDMIFAEFKTVAEANPYKGLSFIDAIKKYIDRSAAATEIRSYYGPFTNEEVAVLADNEYDEIVREAINNKNKFAGWIKVDPKYKEYMSIYRGYPEMFKNVDFERAFDVIKAKCRFIEELNISGKLFDLYKLPEQELMQRAARKRISSKIKFIMEHNTKYHPRETNRGGFDLFNDNSFEIEHKLNSLSEAEIDDIYAETFIDFANSHHPEFMIEPLTMDLYLKLIDEDKEQILHDIYRDASLRELAKNIFELRLGTNKPIYTYEDLTHLDDQQIMNLELEIWNERMTQHRNSQNQGTGGRK